ncbi:MAG TPA: glycosyltransferase family 4 protein [Acidimicrobiia bacterium]
MIRLLSVQPVAERGGSDHALLRMMRSLPSDEFECHVVVPSDPPLRDELESAGVTVHVVPMERISTSHGIAEWAGYGIGWPVAVTRIARLVRRLDIDVVHTNSLHSWYGWAAAGLTRRPHVWHAREIVVQSRTALGFERFLTRYGATRVIAMSQAIAEQLDPSVDAVVIHEVADPAEFHPTRAGRFRARVGIPDDAPLAGTASRIDTWKGIDVLLDAWRPVKNARPDAHLVVAGGPVRGKESYFDDLARVAAALSDVHWLGMRDDVPDLFADLDVFVLPSTEPEPYGIVAVEALASGVPVVATDGGGPPEILASAHPGAGRLVPPGDAAALAAAIVEVVDAAVPTSSATRARRAPLRDLEPERFAAVFRAVVEGDR